MSNKFFSFEIIEDAVHRVLNGTSRADVAKDIGTTKTTVSSWVLKVQANGIESLVPSRTKKRLSTSEKIVLVKLFEKSDLGLNEFSRAHNLKTSSTLRRWLKKYKNGTLFEKKNGCTRMANTEQTKLHTLSERMKVVNWLLQHEKNYNQAAVIFNVSYQQSYSWLKKYVQSGPEGLKNHRGRNRTVESLSELDQLKLAPILKSGSGHFY